MERACTGRGVHLLRRRSFVPAWGNGEAALVEPSPEGYREQGRFSPPNPPKRANNMEKAWAYPVVAGGRLYLRDHGCLWCYDVQAGASNN
jgi:hypothetical protein